MTDYQTKQRQRNMIVGSFVIIALGAFFWMLLRFRDLPLAVSKFKSFNVLVYFPEAPGVQKDTPVQYCGYQIGRVMKVAPPQLQDGSHKVGITMAIEKRYSDISEAVDFYVMKRGLGSSFIELRLDPVKVAESNTYLCDETTRYDGQVGMASDFFPPEVQAALPDLVDAITDLTNNINIVIGDTDNQANIKKTLENFQFATAQLNDTLKSVEQITDIGAEKITLVSDQLEQTLAQTQQLIAKIESGDGTAGKLVNDGRLYENLLESSEELKMLLEQLKQWTDEVQEDGVKVKTKIF